MKNENLSISREEIKEIIDELIQEKLNAHTDMEKAEEEDACKSLWNSIQNIIESENEVEEDTDEECEEYSGGYMVVDVVDNAGYVVVSTDNPEDVSICSHSLLCELALAGLIDNAEVDEEEKKISVYLG